MKDPENAYDKDVAKTVAYKCKDDQELGDMGTFYLTLN